MTAAPNVRVRDSILIYAAALALYAIAALWLRSPGYMDAEYYWSTGRELAAGRGFQEPFLWNYLDDPVGIPHPSHQYWMPLASIVAAIGTAVFGTSFRGAQLPFVLIAAGLPVLTYALGWSLYGDRSKARWAALLAVFPGLFMPFLLTTDTFGLFGLLGGGALTILAVSGSPGPRSAALAGVLVGLAHLARADGMLLWAPLLCAIASTRERRPRLLLAAVAGYAVVLTPWLARNLVDTGHLWPTGGSRALWLLSYDETFSFPSAMLTSSRWWAVGIGALLRDRQAAMWTNARSLLVVNGMAILGFAMAAGAWRRRTSPLVRVSFVYLIVLWAVMSFVFPYAGARGGFFHSSAALMPLLFALVPEGLEAFVGIGARWRGWSAARATRLFAASAVGLAAAFTTWALWSRITGDGAGAGWERNARTYETVAGLLSDTGGPVAVNDAPGLYLATDRPTLAIPNGGPDTLRAVVDRYSAGWVVLEKNHPRALDGLYLNPEASDFLGSPIRFIDADGLPAYLFPVKR